MAFSLREILSSVGSGHQAVLICSSQATSGPRVTFKIIEINDSSLLSLVLLPESAETTVSLIFGAARRLVLPLRPLWIPFTFLFFAILLGLDV